LQPPASLIDDLGLLQTRPVRKSIGRVVAPGDIPAQPHVLRATTLVESIGRGAQVIVLTSVSG